MRIAVIVSIRNEEADVLKFLRAIEFQSRRPDLLALTIVASTDRTAQFVLDWAALTTLKVKIDYMDDVPGSRSIGRNIAIGHALALGDAEIVVLTNVCEPMMYWLETLVKPIEEGFADAVGGSYTMDTRSDREDAMSLLTQYSTEQLDSTKISALNLALDSNMFEKIGLFNSELNTSEDSEFIQRLNDASNWVAFEPNAVVLWRPSTLTLHNAAKVYFEFAKTDRRAGLKGGQYLATGLAYMTVGILAIVAPPLAVLTLGTWLGFRARKVIADERLLSEVPFALVAAFVLDWARLVGYAAGHS